MNIDKNEVLRYLGYRGREFDGIIMTRIDETIEEIKSYIMPKYSYIVFDIQEEENGVMLKNHDLVLKGEDIKKHLHNCSLCAILAATLGIGVDNRIRYYEKADMAKALIMDACATAAIESLCEEIEYMVKKDAAAKLKTITNRYSPGYGDFSLDHQYNMLRLLKADKKLGLAVNESYMLIPQKSVTAVIGFLDEVRIEKKNICEGCSSFESCSFRRAGMKCEF